MWPRSLSSSDQLARALERRDLVDQRHVGRLLGVADAVAVLACRRPRRSGRRPAGRPPSRCAGGSSTAAPRTRARGTPGTRRSRAGSSCRRACRRCRGSRRSRARAPTLRACSSCSPSQNSSTILAQKAGRSSGLREDTRPWSTTTSSSTQLPPALRMSVCSDGHEVIVRPCSTSASTSVHGPWQITPTGLAASKKPRTKPTASSSMRRKSGFATPPGQHEAVVVADVGVAPPSCRPRTCRPCRGG